MASLDEVITVMQNIVIAINSVSHKIDDIEGSTSLENFTTSTLVKKGTGRIVRVSVTTAGSTVGSVYDAASATLTAASNLLATIPNTVGVYDIKMPFENGLVLAPGTSQVLSVSFS